MFAAFKGALSTFPAIPGKTAASIATLHQVPETLMTTCMHRHEAHIGCRSFNGVLQP